MSAESYPFFVLRGDRYSLAGGNFSTLEEAIAGVEKHFRLLPIEDPVQRAWQELDNLTFRVYRAIDDPCWIVEVTPDAGRAGTSLAIYKILQGCVPNPELGAPAMVAA
jgi:hypothetical protein